MEIPQKNCPDYALIVGQGRSGTNWLLDLLDLSPVTYCRNEADKLITCPLAQLPSPVVCQPVDESFAKQWDQAIQATALRMGERDRIGANPKIYLHETIRQIGRLILDKPKVRHFFSGLMPTWKESDWQIPQWFAHRELLKQALPVFKLNQIPGWAQWVLLNRPHALVIHIVRHPGGFLNSWYQRYLKIQDFENVKQANIDRLKKIILCDQVWAQRFGKIETMTVEESELWYWCYANENVYRAGEGRSNYLRIIYEDLVGDPLNTTKFLYAKCGLPWTENIENSVIKSSSPSDKIASAWSKNLSKEQIDLVNSFLSNSFMGQWWDRG